MKKIFKNRFMTLVIATVMILLNFSITTFAEEVGDNQSMFENAISVEQLENGKTRTTYEFEVFPKSVDEYGIATYAIDSSFTMTGTYYRGADRKYSGNYISYQMTVTATNGSAVNKQVSIQLWDYNTSHSLQTNIVTANGITVMEPEVPIKANRTYYFKYYLVGGTTSNLRIRMVIDTWS